MTTLSFLLLLFVRVGWCDTAPWCMPWAVWGMCCGALRCVVVQVLHLLFDRISTGTGGSGPVEAGVLVFRVRTAEQDCVCDALTCVSHSHGVCVVCACACRVRACFPGFVPALHQ